MKKATLLITHIYKLYTNKVIHHHHVILTDAYIGIFHDKIIAVGVGAYHHLIDKDTRVIDAVGHIAVPGFIDCCLVFENEDDDQQQRKIHEVLVMAMKQGVTTAHIPVVKPLAFYNTPFFEVLWDQPLQRYPMLRVHDVLHLKSIRNKLCITSSYDSLHPLKTAQLAYLKYHTHPNQLLAMLTTYPAKQLHLSACGRLEVGMQADLLLINALSLKEMFSNLRDDMIYQVVKKGVRVYPNVIV